jgi:hypothetical protein
MYCCGTDPIRSNYYVYRFIRANGGFRKWSMIELEKFPCKDKHEALLRERYWIKSLNASLNTQIPSAFEYKQSTDSKSDKVEYDRLYAEHNKEKIYLRKSARCECECGLSYLHGNQGRHFRKAQHQDYFEDHAFEYTYCFEDGSASTLAEYQRQ